jgi:3-deoxy-D-manno-octulosonic-acid transferase
MRPMLDLVYAATLLPHYVYHRAITGKYGAAAPEKLGRGLLPGRLDAAPALPARPRLWVHAVSVGEVLAARSLVAAFRQARPEWDVVVSTTTATGRAVAQKHFGAENVFYYPLDFSGVVRRVFETIRPSLLVLMELEVWPHALAEAERRGVPTAVSNVRITEASIRRFRLAGRGGRGLLQRVRLWISQNEEYAGALRALGVPPERIEVVGSLKYDGLDFAERPAVAARLHRELGGGRLLVAGSTHAGEDEIVYQSFTELRREFGEELRLVLVPRHPERCAAVARLAPAGLRLHRRSAGPAPEGTDILLGDTMGELSDFYRAAEVVVIGGTFEPAVGGHNMLEPAAFGKPVVYGPAVHNFLEPAAVLEAAGAAERLSEPAAAALTAALRPLLADPEEARRRGARGREAARALQGAAARSVTCLEPLLQPEAPA